jgi:hypothetical protein
MSNRLGSRQSRVETLDPTRLVGTGRVPPRSHSSARGRPGKKGHLFVCQTRDYETIALVAAALGSPLCVTPETPRVRDASCCKRGCDEIVSVRALSATPGETPRVMCKLAFHLQPFPRRADSPRSLNLTASGPPLPHIR